jgi:hypothetical protein
MLEVIFMRDGSFHMSVRELAITRRILVLFPAHLQELLEVALFSPDVRTLASTKIKRRNFHETIRDDSDYHLCSFISCLGGTDTKSGFPIPSAGGIRANSNHNIARPDTV